MAYAKVGRVVSLALLALLVGSIATATTVSGPGAIGITKAFSQTDEPVDFVANIEYIRGHLEKAVENKDAGNNTLAVAHAGHPVAEVYTLIKGDIQAADAALDAKLEGDLDALYAQIGWQNMTAADAKAKVAEINASLDSAMAEVVGKESINNSTTLWAQAAMRLLSTSVEEYKEGVANGTNIQMIEYQDANAFMHRAQVIFDRIKAGGDQEDAKEIEEFFGDLNGLVAAKAEPAQIAAQVDAMNNKFMAAFSIDHGVEVDAEAVNFAANVEMIKGHMSQAIIDVKNNDYSLATAHATHPIAEHYALLKEAVNEHDPALGTNLESGLTSFAATVKNMTTGETRFQVAKITRLLNAATSDVVTPSTWSDFKFRAAVANALLSAMQEEYAEGVQGGKIIQMVEYQDAQAFMARADVLFRTFQNQLSTHEAEEARMILADLNASVKDVKEPAAIDTLAQGAIHEIQEGAGIKTVAHEMTSVEFVEKIRTLLGELKQAYAAGNYTQADSLAVEAYLDNFEHVEGPLVDAGQMQLKDDMEQLMRVQLRDMIKEKVPADQINAHVDNILDKLNLVEKALA